MIHEHEAKPSSLRTELSRYVSFFLLLRQKYSHVHQRDEIQARIVERIARELEGKEEKEKVIKVKTSIEIGSDRPFCRRE